MNSLALLHWTLSLFFLRCPEQKMALQRGREHGAAVGLELSCSHPSFFAPPLPPPSSRTVFAFFPRLVFRSSVLACAAPLYWILLISRLAPPMTANPQTRFITRTHWPSGTPWRVRWRRHRKHITRMFFSPSVSIALFLFFFLLLSSQCSRGGPVLLQHTIPVRRRSSTNPYLLCMPRVPTVPTL